MTRFTRPLSPQLEGGGEAAALAAFGLRERAVLLAAGAVLDLQGRLRLLAALAARGALLALAAGVLLLALERGGLLVALGLAVLLVFLLGILHGGLLLVIGRGCLFEWRAVYHGFRLTINYG